MQHADLIIKNGNIHTMNPAKPTAAAVAVRGNESCYVGDNPENFCGAGTKVVDAEGRVVLPGIVDAHAHPLSMPSFEGVALDIGMDLETVLSEIKKYVVFVNRKMVHNSSRKMVHFKTRKAVVFMTVPLVFFSYANTSLFQI